MSEPTISPLDLNVIARLYAEAKDAYNPENSDHRHLHDALLDVVGLLHREKHVDDGLYAIECEFLGGGQ